MRRISGQSLLNTVAGRIATFLKTIYISFTLLQFWLTIHDEERYYFFNVVTNLRKAKILHCLELESLRLWIYATVCVFRHVRIVFYCILPCDSSALSWCPGLGHNDTRSITGAWPTYRTQSRTTDDAIHEIRPPDMFDYAMATRSHSCPIKVGSALERDGLKFVASFWSAFRALLRKWQQETEMSG